MFDFSTKKAKVTKDTDDSTEEGTNSEWVIPIRSETKGNMV